MNTMYQQAASDEPATVAALRNVLVVLNPSSVDVSPDLGSTEGPGLHLHAADIAATVVHLAGLPRRTVVREAELWGTNP